MIATLPMYAALKEKFPGSYITFAAAPTNYPIPFIDINPFLDEVLVYDKSSFRTLAGFYKKLWKRKYDLAIAQSTIKMSRTAHVICFLSGAKIKLGVAGVDAEINKAAYLLNMKKPFNWISEKKHQGERGLEMISQLFDEKLLLKDYSKSTGINFNDTDIKAADNFLKQFKDDNYILGIHPGAGKLENIWDYKNFIEVIKKLNEKEKVNIVITCGLIDEEIVSKISASLKELQIPFLIAKNFSIKGLAALISKFRLYITNDTGPMHIAGSTFVNQISLFGPTDAWEWAPFGQNKISIQSPSKNINDISISEILQKITSFNTF